MGSCKVCDVPGGFVLQSGGSCAFRTNTSAAVTSRATVAAVSTSTSSPFTTYNAPTNCSNYFGDRACPGSETTGSDSAVVAAAAVGATVVAIGLYLLRRRSRLAEAHALETKQPRARPSGVTPRNNPNRITLSPATTAMYENSVLVGKRSGVGVLNAAFDESHHRGSRLGAGASAGCDYEDIDVHRHSEARTSEIYEERGWITKRSGPLHKGPAAEEPRGLYSLDGDTADTVRSPDAVTPLPPGPFLGGRSNSYHEAETSPSPLWPPAGGSRFFPESRIPSSPKPRVPPMPGIIHSDGSPPAPPSQGLPGPAKMMNGDGNLVLVPEEVYLESKRKSLANTVDGDVDATTTLPTAADKGVSTERRRSQVAEDTMSPLYAPPAVLSDSYDYAEAVLTPVERSHILWGLAVSPAQLQLEGKIGEDMFGRIYAGQLRAATTSAADENARESSVPVAIKMLKVQELGTDQVAAAAALDDLEREAVLTGSLSHPNVCILRTA